MQYAKIENKRFTFPSYEEFIGIPNWWQHDAELRKKNYFPVVNMPPAVDGKTLVIDSAEKKSQTTVRLIPKLVDGVWEDRETIYDTSYIELKSWHYEDVQIVESSASLGDYNRALEDYLLQVRSARGYTDREPSDYYNSGVARWAQDARDWVAFRDRVMTYGLEMMNQYQSTGEAPLSLGAFRAGLEAIQISWTYEE